VTVTNVRNNNATFDIIVTYGTRIEAFRGITLPAVSRSPTNPDAKINGVSTLATVAPPSGKNFGTKLGTVPVPAINWIDVTDSLTYVSGSPESLTRSPAPRCPSPRGSALSRSSTRRRKRPPAARPWIRRRESALPVICCRRTRTAPTLLDGGIPCQLH
jgi:hypothetical protein